MLNTKISWADHTWNPWVGCQKVSAGCDNCYMFTEQRRYGKEPSLIRQTKTKQNMPLQKNRAGEFKIKSGERVFVCSWSDFFLPVADKWRAGALEIIAKRSDVNFLIVTKRPERILEVMPDGFTDYPNVWLGVTAENQQMAYSRISQLLQIPAHLKFVSVEPMLTAIDLSPILHAINWVIIGGESGHNARPMHPDWVDKIVNDCDIANVPAFFKQWGNWQPFLDVDVDNPARQNLPEVSNTIRRMNIAGNSSFDFGRMIYYKKSADKLETYYSELLQQLPG